MKIKLKPIKETVYEIGEYYANPYTSRVVTIVEDEHRGFALMDVETARITSDFHDEIELLQEHTTLGQMTPLIQVNEVEFEEYE